MHGNAICGYNFPQAYICCSTFVKKNIKGVRNVSIYSAGRPFKYNPANRNNMPPPARAGEYRIKDSSGNIVYLGESNNLARRTREHIRQGKLCGDFGRGNILEYKIADGRSTSNTRRIHERQKIKQHYPIYNKSSGGEGRPAGK